MRARPRRFGRYLLFEPFARGGMAEVCFGRATGPAGFSRVFAVKRTHEHLAKNPDFVSMLVDEGRLAGRIRHPNVVPVIDVVQLPGELLLVMDYVDGVPLGKLWRRRGERGERFPPDVAVAVVVGLLQGLHAAHEVRDERGEPCGIVHRDVSPQNVLVGRDGLARVTDFGIALARERLQFTRTDEIKGKLEYMSREQVRRERVDRRTDVYAASLILWELLTGTRPFADDTDQSVLSRISAGDMPRASALVPDLPPELDELVGRGLSPHAAERFATAFEMASALERVLAPASQLEVARFVEREVGDDLARRARRVHEIEAWQEEPAPSAGAETLVRDVGHDDEGPTLVVNEPVDERPPVSAAPAPAQSRQKWVWALPLSAFALGALLLGVVAVTRLGSAPVEAVASEPVVAASPAPTPATVEPPLPVAPMPSASPADAATPAPPRVTKPKPPRPAGPACDPPYRVDEKGVRVPKRECFPQ